MYANNIYPTNIGSYAYVVNIVYFITIHTSVESHIGVAWRLKNVIPNSHILDQVSLAAMQGF